jgi:FkbM family methyltransferase
MGKPVLFYCDPKSGVEHAIIKYGFFGSHILEFMAELLSPESVVLDIGANIGAYSIPLAKAFPDVTVHAFEPNPYAVARFRRNLLVNRIDNIRLHEKALGEEAGTLEFYAIEGRDIGLSSFIDRSFKEAHPMRMQLTRLDDMLDQDLSRVSVIKIDVQGFESQVLRGATRLLRRDRPYVLFEHEDDNFTEKDRAKDAKMGLCRLFAEHGYEVHYMTKHDPRILFPVQWEKPLNGDLLAIPITAHPVAPSAVEI